MNYSDVIRDFALRTRQNLKAIDALAAQGQNVFEVTQLVNSMLGLLVFPQQRYVDEIEKIPLAELQQLGWPIPKLTGTFEQVDNLNQLIRYLRNAVSHFNIKFVDSGNGRIDVLRVWNMAPLLDAKGKIQRNDRGKIIEYKNWEAELGVNELRGIADRFIGQILKK